jgi:hypothetical protein
MIMETWLDLEQRYQHLLSTRFQGWEIGEGWKALVEEVLHELDQAAPDVRVTQVKEKFGTLRIYVANKKDDVAKEIVRSAEARSATICEICGQQGDLIREDAWVRVRCPDHRDQDDVG